MRFALLNTWMSDNLWRIYSSYFDFDKVLSCCFEIKISASFFFMQTLPSTEKLQCVPLETVFLWSLHTARPSWGLRIFVSYFGWFAFCVVFKLNLLRNPELACDVISRSIVLPSSEPSWMFVDVLITQPLWASYHIWTLVSLQFFTWCCKHKAKRGGPGGGHVSGRRWRTVLLPVRPLQIKDQCAEI